MLDGLLVTMTLSGLAGGLTNYFLADKPAQTEVRLRKWWQYALVGLCASFTVPLFLNTISSPLIVDVIGSDLNPTSASKLLVVTGFCILASVSSRAFMQSLMSRVLKVAEDAKEKSEEASLTSQIASRKSDVAAGLANDAKSDIALLVEPSEKAYGAGEASSESERNDQFNFVSELRSADYSIDGGSSTRLEARDGLAGNVKNVADKPQLPDLEMGVLAALIESNFTLRSLTGIAKEQRMGMELVGRLLESMQHKGLVAATVDSRGNRKYSVTMRGRELFLDDQKKRSSPARD